MKTEMKTESKFGVKTDQQIHMDVLDALKFDPQIREQNIAVAVQNGIVTLSGEVESHAQKVAAEAATKRVAGVRGFAEELRINPPAHHRRNDQEIAAAALNALTWHVLVPSGRIRVKVEQGWVTLFGEVNWNFEREGAYDAVRMLTGVRGITNKIDVTPDKVSVDIKSQILLAFERAARQEAENVKVRVMGGSVTLEGQVSSWAEYDRAEHAAWSAAGVSQVHNKLVVQPQPAEADEAGAPTFLGAH